MNLSIRQASIEDAPLLSRILCRSWRYGYRGMIDQDYLDTLREDLWVDRFCEWLENDVMDIAIAFEGNRAAGCIAYGASREKVKDGWGEISILYMLPDHMGKGYGARLMRHAVASLREKGYKKCFLWALRENTRAINFYEKQGFTNTMEELPIEVGKTKSVDYRLTKEL